MAHGHCTALSPDYIEHISQRLSSLSMLVQQHPSALPSPKPNPSLPCYSPTSDDCTSTQLSKKDHLSTTETLSTSDLEAEGTDFSFQSSLYSDESHKETARQLARTRSSELKRIREDSKSIQQAVKTKVREIHSDTLENESRGPDFDEELEFYDAQLERLKEAVSSMLPIHSEFSGNERSPHTSKLAAELRSLRQDVKSLEERLQDSENQRACSVHSAKSLSLQLTELQGSFEALNARLTFDATACRSCVLF